MDYIKQLADIMRQMEQEGLFEKARKGDQKAASLFVRLAAFRANPNGADEGGWGWLAKTGGGTNVDGYAEDALALNKYATSNVYDLVGGAGRDGATINFNPGPVFRRERDLWEAPKQLSREDLAYLGSTGSGGVDPKPQPQPIPTICKFQPHDPIDLGPLMGELMQVKSMVEEARNHASEADKWSKITAERLNQANDQIAQLKEQAKRGFRARLFGQSITLTPVE